MTGDRKKVLLVIGPESSGTRWIARLIGSHPAVLGRTGEGGTAHQADALSDVWNGLMSEPLPRLPDFGNCSAILTRRSLPHGPAGGGPAAYLEFVDLERFHDVCVRDKAELFVIVTSRSPAAHLASWTLERASTGRDWERATQQYRAAYGHLFRFLVNRDVKYLMTSMEGFALDGGEYLNGLFRLIGLPEHDVPIELQDANAKRYDWHRDSGKTL